jgi:hypothetical protein
MRTLTVIPQPNWQHKRLKHARSPLPADGKHNNTARQTPPPVNLQRHPRPRNPKRLGGHIAKRIRHAFTPLIDAKAASVLLGVPYTWLLAQARANKIPHHRLGHLCGHPHRCPYADAVTMPTGLLRRIAMSLERTGFSVSSSAGVSA